MTPTTRSSGHAAVGRVVGTRNPDGSRPAFVDITYVRNGSERSARVRREVSGQQVEFSDADTVRFWTDDGNRVLVDELLDVAPAGED